MLFRSQMLTSMKGEINNTTIIVGDFNTPLTPMDTSSPVGTLLDERSMTAVVLMALPTVLSATEAPEVIPKEITGRLHCAGGLRAVFFFWQN